MREKAKRSASVGKMKTLRGWDDDNMSIEDVAFVERELLVATRRLVHGVPELVDGAIEISIVRIVQRP